MPPKTSNSSSPSVSPPMAPKTGTSPPLQPAAAPPLAADAAEFRPSWLKKVHRYRYTIEQLRNLRAAAVAPSLRNVIDYPPFQRIPATLVPYLTLRHFQEFVVLDYDEAAEGPRDRSPPQYNQQHAVVVPQSQPQGRGNKQQQQQGKGAAAAAGASEFHAKRSPPQRPQSFATNSPPQALAALPSLPSATQLPPSAAAAATAGAHGDGSDGRVSPTQPRQPVTLVERLRAHELFCPELDPATNYYCVTCASNNKPCASVQLIIDNVMRHERQSALGAFFMQNPAVVGYSLLVLQVFEGKRTSMRMRTLKEKCPKVPGIVKQFLCGDGFHIPPPSIAAHEKWQVLLERLKFTWIRDNRTRIYTELSRNWKRTHSPFEQFMHFYFFRTAMPFHKTKGMLLHRQKPVIIACLAGDIEAVVLLCELGFEVPSDLLWERLPYFKEYLDPKVYCVLRHLCVHYYRAQLQAGGGNGGSGAAIAVAQ